MEPHTEVTAHVSDRHGATEEVYVGSLPTWAWQDPSARRPWTRARRAMVLEDRTADPQGWRVRFTGAEA